MENGQTPSVIQSGRGGGFRGGSGGRGAPLLRGGFDGGRGGG